MQVLVVTLLLIMSGVNGFAQSQGSGSADDKGLRTEVINFEDELVQGQNVKPELFYLLQQKNFNYNRLIRMRENFIPEAKRSFENLQMNRGSN